MSEVRMYCTSTCPYCIAAERLLRAKGVQEIVKIRVDLEPARRTEMIEQTGRRTVPQIWIGGRHVGGFDDLSALEGQGALDSLLEAGAAQGNP